MKIVCLNRSNAHILEAMTTLPLHHDVIEFLDGQSLLETYPQADGQAGKAMAEALLAEPARRNLKI
jgi:hypothetical protein